VQPQDPPPFAGLMLLLMLFNYVVFPIAALIILLGIKNGLEQVLELLKKLLKESNGTSDKEKKDAGSDDKAYPGAE